MEILISNDDGVDSPGLAALAEAFAQLGRVVVVAPDRERSGVAHALTLRSPLRLKEVRKDWYSTDGMPTDCVHLGVHSILNRPPDLLVSGINTGPNMGDDITYSGTVGVAMEGALLGVPSIAVSLAARSDFNFGPAAQVALRVAKMVCAKGLPPRTYLNVNVPNVASYEELGPVTMTRQGRRVYGSEIIRKTDPRGEEYYWVGGQELGRVAGDEGTDIHAVDNGRVSITPLTTDMTHKGLCAEMRGWDW